MFPKSRTLLALTLALSASTLLMHAQQDSATIGAVFVMTNNAARNEVIAYTRNADGSLTGRHSFATGGRGSGGVTDPLASQGSLTLTQDRSYLLAVNAGSGDISVFKVSGSTLTLVGTTPCGGSEPVAVAQRSHLVYVVNAGGTSNVTGFHFTAAGTLKPIPNATAFLSTGNSGASSVAFSPDGQTLLATEKLTGNIDAFAIHADGTLGPIVLNPSSGAGLFGVLFAPNGAAITTETGPSGASDASAVSSYSVNAAGTLSVISASVPALGNATCWHVVTPNGKLLYTANSASGSISGFWIGSTGTLTPVDATVVATLPTGSVDLDIAVTQDGKYLYTIDSGTGSVSALAINADGTLTTLSGASGLTASAGFNGIAAF
jgi:6-phosphogluconolactonase (cycloisomerase 2 family)